MTTRDNRMPGRTVEGVLAPGGTVPFGEGSPRVPSSAPQPPRFNWQVVRSVRMHPKLAAGVGGAVCLALIFLGFTQSPVYKAESRVFVDPLVPGSISPTNGQPGYDQFRYGSYLDQQIQTVTRADILTAALKSLPAGTWRQPGESEQSAVTRLQKALVVERLTDGYEFSVKLSTPKAASSAALVNAVTEAYLTGGRRDELTEVDGREQILEEERQRIKDALEKDEAEQAALGTNLGVANPATENGNPFDLQLANLRAQLETAREAHDVAAAQLSSLSGSDESHKSGLTAVADESLNTDLGLSSMKQSINQRRAVLQSQMAGLTPSNPLYKQDQDELADLDRMLDSETVKMRGAAERRIQDKLRADLQKTASVEAELNAQLGRETAKATSAGPKLLRANELATDIRRLNERYTDVDTTLRALLLQTNGPGMAHITLKATVPSSPESSRRGLFLLAALPLGALFGMLAAVIARLRDKRIYLASDLEETLGFPPLAVLPASSDVPPRVVHEYLLRFAAGVEGAYRSAGARTFLMTGVSARSQTHPLVSALASKLEDLRIHVVVISTTELLATSRESAEHLAATESDAIDRAATASEGIATLKLQRLKGSYDIVLVDAAPLLHAAETEYVARCADATILIVESGEVRSPEVSRAAALLSRLHMSGVAVVLDGVRLRDADEAFREAVGVVDHRTVDALPRRAVETAKPQEMADQLEDRLRATIHPSEEIVAPAPAIVEAAPAALMHHEVEERGPEQVAETQGDTHAAPVASAFAAIEPVVNEPITAELVAIDPVPGNNQRFAMAKEKPYVPDLFKNPSIRPIDPSEKITPKFGRRASDFAESALGEPNRTLIRPIIPGAKRADGTPIPSAHAAPVHEVEVVKETEPVVAELPAFEPAPVAPEVVAHEVVEHEVVEPLKAEPVETVQAVEPYEATVPAIAANSSPEASSEEPAFRLSQSKIRFAFKEERVNSKTTWFSKLFRGDPPSSFKIIPDDEAEEAIDGEWKPIEKQQVAEPEHLSAHPQTAPSDFEAALLAPVREDRSQVLPKPEVPSFAPAHTAKAVAVETEEELVAQRFAALAPIPAPPSIVLPSAPVAVATPERPLRPITFQQLSGEQPLEIPAPVPDVAAAPKSALPVEETLLPRVAPPTVALWPEKKNARLEPVPVEVAAQPVAATIPEPVVVPQPQVAHPAPLRQALGRIVSKLEATRPQPVQSELREQAAKEQPVAVPAIAAGRSVRQFGAPVELEEREALPFEMPHEFRRQQEIASASNGSDGIAGLSRRWALLSKYDPTETDPFPASRRAPEPEFSGSEPWKNGDR